MSSLFPSRMHTSPMPAWRLLLPSLFAVALLVALQVTLAGPAVAAGKKSAHSVTRKAATAKAKAPRPKARSAPVVVAEPEIELSPAQVAAAGHVLVGQMSCEFGQTVQIAPLAQRPGQFQLTLGRDSYRLVPQETTTGAVRLEDQKDGIVWLQIPSKSMLLSARLGQRLVDNCLHEEQRGYVVSSANALGIEPASAAAGAVLAQDGPLLPPPPPAVPVLALDALVAASPLLAGADAGVCIDPHFQDALTVALTGADMQAPAPWLDCGSACSSTCAPAQADTARWTRR